MEINNLYNIYIYEKYHELIKSEKQLDNNDIWKIFEWYTCIKLYEQYNKLFYEYSDIDPTFKEDNQLSQNDTGIDASDLTNTIVQCKLRKENLTWKECSTFFASQTIFSEKENKTIIRWNNLIISRNTECKLSDNLMIHSKKFTNKSFNSTDIIDYCDNLLQTPPIYPKTHNNNFTMFLL